MSASFSGYPGRIWGVCWQSLSWLSTLLAQTTSPVTLTTPVQTVFQTLWNGLQALSAWQTGATLSVETQNLDVLESLTLNLDSVTQSCLVSRSNSVGVAATQISALVPPISLYNIAATLRAGQPAIADPGFLEWCMAFDAESPPSSAFLLAGTAIMVQSWQTIVNAVGALQGSSPTTVYDTAARQLRCCQMIANILNDLQTAADLNNNTFSYQVPMVDSDGNPMFDSLNQPMFTDAFFGGASSGWSSTVALPIILLDAASMASNPALLLSQQVSVIRYALSAQLQQLSRLLLSMRSHTVTQPSTARLRTTESLLDLAARTSGNFENWTVIAALNAIEPPWPGPSNPTLALSGQSLFTSGQGITAGAQPNYANNILGVDYNFGPINGIQPPWLGDISLITGYYNFARAIGRRLQTTLGTLIYHTEYGCSIPPEVGAIQSRDEASRLAAYGRSAIAGDPRTGAILAAKATVQPGFLATFSATVAPIGPGSTPVSINEVIGVSA